MFSRQEIASLNELEFTVYKYILENSQKVPYMTIRELAVEVHVSTNTILRFCKKLNFGGFTEFKIRFKMSLEQGSFVVPAHDHTMLYEFLKRAEGKEFDKNLDVVSHVLEQAKQLIFIGYGNSGAMAQYAAKYFSSVGKFALHIESPMYDISPENPEGSVVIFFSVSGENNSAIRNISSLKTKKTTVISVTNSSNCTMAKLSDYNIAYYVQYESRTAYSYVPRVDTTTQVPVIYIIEVLAKKIYSIKNS